MNPYLKPYMALIEFLGKTFGPDYEVALHEFNKNDCSVTAITNAHISGRKIGSPLNQTALEAVSKGVYKHQDYLSDYISLSADGKILRSCTYFIKDSHENLIGLLCINFDDSRYKHAIKSILEMCHPNEFIDLNYTYKNPSGAGNPPSPGDMADYENFYTTMEENVDEFLLRQEAEYSVPISRLTMEEKTELISRMNEKGIFFLKGAVKYVAGKLGCSQASLYRYLNKAKEKNAD